MIELNDVSKKASTGNPPCPHFTRWYCPELLSRLKHSGDSSAVYGWCNSVRNVEYALNGSSGDNEKQSIAWINAREVEKTSYLWRSQKLNKISSLKKSPFHCHWYHWDPCWKYGQSKTSDPIPCNSNTYVPLFWRSIVEVRNKIQLLISFR